MGNDATIYEERAAIGEAMVKKGSAKLDDYVDFFDYEGNRYGSTKDAKNAAAAYTRGLGLLFLGEREAARASFEACLALKPDHFWAKEMVTALGRSPAAQSWRTRGAGR